MTTFLDKLKKGMDSEESFEESQETTNEPKSEKTEPAKEKNLKKEPVAISASMPNTAKKTPKSKKAKKLPSVLAKTELISKPIQQKSEEKVKPI
ncbi:MAG: hypothetical protein U9Q16_01735, partial [Patescibacteria group bacterium]|nr:hypothetical protein [Patescibacteria group bacterium]